MGKEVLAVVEVMANEVMRLMFVSLLIVIRVIMRLSVVGK